MRSSFRLPNCRRPNFDSLADPAVNYGAIGAVIGHELTHGFDDDGSKFDGAGVLTDWWTDMDAEQFKARAAELGRQYDSYKPYPGAHVNGDRIKATEDSVRQQLVSDPHAPNQFRVEGSIRNMDAWYDAFGVKPEDKLYLAPEKSVRIW